MKKILREYIREALKESGQLDAYAFADERRDVPNEPNNKIEVGLLKDILSYLNGTVQMSPRNVEMIKGFLSKGEYSDIFVKPDVPDVYRGIFMFPEEASKLIGLPPENFNVKMGRHDGDLILRPRDGEVSSWSRSFSTAVNFGRNALHKYGKGGEIILVFKASTGDNDGSMLDLKKIYGLKNPIMASVMGEGEVFGFGPIKTFQVKWYMDF